MVRRCCLAAALGGVLTAPNGTAQAPAIPASHSAPTIETSTTKPLAFDVVSIRPSNDAEQGSLGAGPDGFFSRNQPLLMPILMAYMAHGMDYWGESSLSGAPAWVSKDRYDFVAKVAQADLPHWQAMNHNFNRSPMLQPMLQAALVERCKLVVHRVPIEITGYELPVGKRGQKLTESKAEEELPKGLALPDGGVMVWTGRDRKDIEWTFHHATMAELAAILSSWMNSEQGPRPVVDRTGLPGRYDFVLAKRAGDDAASDPELTTPWTVDSLGLTLRPAKLPSETLVIDHIERPSEN